MRLLHTSITVKRMDDSISFYQEKLGMRLVKRRPIPENRAEIAFLEDPESGGQIELTHWWDKTELVEGDQLDHLAFQVEDVLREVEKLRRDGVEIAKEPFSLKGSSSKIAFVKDPNGIWIELIEK